MSTANQTEDVSMDGCFVRLQAAMLAKCKQKGEMVLVVRDDVLVVFTRRPPNPLQTDRGEDNFISASLANGLGEALSKLLRQAT